MNARRNNFRQLLPILLPYALFGALWVFASDRLLDALVSDAAARSILQTFKGWFFVAASTALLYVVTRLGLRARTRAEQELQESEEKYRTLIQAANDAIFVFDAETGVVLDVNKKGEELLGLPAAQIIGGHHAAFHPPEYREECRNIFAEVVKGGKIVSGNLCMVSRNGQIIPVEISVSTVSVRGKVLVQSILRDVTERRRAEDELRSEKDRAQRYLDIAGVMIVVIEADERVRLINKTGCRILGFTEQEILGANWFDRFIPEGKRAEARQIYRRLLSGREQGLEYFEFPVLTKSGEERIMAWHNTLLRNGEGGATGSLSSGEDITARKKAEEQAQARLQRLAGLHAIDLIISSSLDLRVTLNEVLDLVISQMHVDAADILLLHPATQTLEFAAQQGFHFDGIKQSRIRMGQGIAGTAALEHRSISIPDLLAPDTGFLRAPLLEGEGFIAYYVVPLMAKGQVKGVLEVMHRSRLTLDPEKQEFLEALAAQAAIAIDNAALFDELQRSNIELTLAYDATLEGWARALDLRSKATERHTERVTEMTMRLARAMGMSEQELVHVRRGAWLHDIGKIGVPDGILTKAGPLTDEEWKIMRLHPTFAFDMLRPIAYLRPALDIPFSHHEHWDGTGYPRGLKGEQIPLAARIFAVVDTWDALTSSDRPYREPEEKEKVRERIRSLAGTHLDPKAVDVFLQMEW